MYYSFFLLYLIFGFIITLFLFLWAVKNGQFGDQQRARYIPLQAERVSPPAEGSKFNRYQFYGLCGFLLCALLASAGVVIYALIRGG